MDKEIIQKMMEYLEKIAPVRKIKHTGKVEIYTNSGGFVGYKVFKEQKIDKELM